MNNILENFIIDLDKLYKQYENSKNIDELRNNLTEFAPQYANYHALGDLVMDVGKKCINKGDYEAGITIYKTVLNMFPYTVNTTDLYLHMAEYYIENGETEKGIELLIKLCNKVHNYEESIEFNGLTDVWEKYKHLVAEKVPASISVKSSAKALSPGECSMQIDEILTLVDDEILPELSTHLGELSANGECLNCLNKWEKIVFYADELSMEVNSGGFSHYLYYYGHHFEKAKQAFETLEADKMLSLTETVKNKFPRKKVPKKLENIQNTLDKMEEKEIDFEDEDTIYYESAEKELLEKLLTFVKENKTHFR